MDSSGSLDLLIFKKRGYVREEEAVAPQKPQIEMQVPRAKEISGAKPARAKISELYCVNHPWRHAYSVCAIDGLPYCYVDLIEHKGRLYCMQDIDSATKAEQVRTEERQPNAFTTVASVLLLTNSILLGYFTYPQTTYFIDYINRIGGSNLLQILSPGYFLIIANMLVVLFGLIATLAILRRSIGVFFFALVFNICAILVVVYEYLSSNLEYLLVSAILLLITISFATYGKMSAMNRKPSEELMVQDIEWPRPEPY